MIFSDWLRSGDVSGCRPPACTSGRKKASLSHLPRLPAASHDYLLPPTTTCSLPRLPAASHDYLLPPTTTCCQPLVPHCTCLEKGLRYLALDYFYGVVTAQNPR